jgi:hypothetical protein
MAAAQPTPSAPARQWFIYVLRDPRDNLVRYVGWTFDMKKRLDAHVVQAPRQRTHKAHWVMALRSLGLKPAVQEVESGDDPDGGGAREVAWIRFFRALGFPLTNGTDGGDGAPGFHPSAETRAKMSAAHKGRKMPREAVEKSAAFHRGRKQSPEHLAKRSAAQKGKFPPHLKPFLGNWRGRKQTPEHVRKRMVAHIGKPKKPLKLTVDAVLFIRAHAGKISQAGLARMFGVGATTIHNIIRRNDWKHVPPAGNRERTLFDGVNDGRD